MLLAAIVENSADAIIVEDMEGTITSWNAGAERIFGYTHREALGKPIFMIFSKENADEIRSIVERIKGGESVQRLEAIRIRKGGEQLYVALTASPLRDSEGHVAGLVKIIRDITELKRTEEIVLEKGKQLAELNVQLEKTVEERTAKLRETIGELEQMSYSIIHDMRAPLRAITCYADLIKENPTNHLNLESRGFLANMKAAALRMDGLICDLLNYDRLVRQELDLRPINVGELLRGITETYPTFRPPKVQIRIAPDLPWVLGNEAALTQCFSNLLDNAVKFVRQGQNPQVDIQAQIKNGHVHILVRDNGIGIPKNVQKNIFGIFQRGSNGYSGTGIGLAIVT
jgi:PAS domain S-box-containing protein